MHPRNPYKKPPDFLQLAEAYPTLKSQYVTFTCSWPSSDLRCSLIKTRDGFTIDFQNQNAQRYVHRRIFRQVERLSIADVSQKPF